MLVALLLSCADPAATVTPAATVPTAPAAPVAPAPVPVTASEGAPLVATGTVRFEAAKVTRAHIGNFGDWSGSLRMNGDTLAGVEVEVRMASIETDVAKLDHHLKSDDFFGVEAFPVARFVSTEVRAGAPPDNKLADANATVVGDLTIHGVTKRLEVPAVVTVAGDEVHARTEFSIDRHDFGVSYPGKPDDLIRAGVVLRVDLAATRAGATGG